MALFKNKDESPEKWKDKYLKSLDNQELLEKEYKSNEELLCKTIIRFALAIKGLNKELDPHLDNIKTLLRSGLQSHQLQKELTKFSNALVVLEDDNGNHQANAGLLFEFLYNRYPEHQTQLQTIQEKFDRKQFNNEQGLFISLVELLEDKNQPAIEFANDLSDIDYQNIRVQLIRLLEHAEIPESFSETVERIKIRLQDDNNSQLLGQYLDDTISLLIEVKQFLTTEQQEMAVFLSTLTDQLSELAVKLTGINVATEKAIKKRNLLDETVSEQMVDLTNKTAVATQLEPLKQLVHSHLTTISQQIQTHNLQEQVEREYLRQELHVLTQKVQGLESESKELKTKLNAAELSATRDPLTLLPNRLAFEERLNEEMARWQRHGAPLTMIVWDIDFFKKINDNYGHKSGDKALKVIAQLLAKQCRKTDFVARFGGEEFVMLLPDTDVEKALSVAEKLRASVEKASFRASGDVISITLSGGISQIITGDTHETLFERADQALYKAKQSGRNQCVVG